MSKGMQIHMKNISQIKKETTKGSAISYSYWWGKNSRVFTIAEAKCRVKASS